MSRIRSNYTKLLFSLIILVTILAGSLYIIRNVKKSDEAQKTEAVQHEKINTESYKSISSQGIDSILNSYEVKSERITTRYKDSKVSWFTKNVEIPKTLNATKINLEITDYLRSISLNPVVTEDIRTKNITFTVYNDTNNSGSPLAKIFISHENVKR